MLRFLTRLWLNFLKYIVDVVTRLTLLSTLLSVAACLVLFFLCFFAGEPVYAFLSLAGMICFIYANKQF